MFGFGKKEPSAKIPTQFYCPIQRKKADGGILEFHAMVSGYFAGLRGKPTFAVTSITVDCIPNINVSGFKSSEIATIEKYAVDVEYKRLVGRR